MDVPFGHSCSDQISCDVMNVAGSLAFAICSSQINDSYLENLVYAVLPFIQAEIYFAIVQASSIRAEGIRVNSCFPMDEIYGIIRQSHIGLLQCKR